MGLSSFFRCFAWASSHETLTILILYKTCARYSSYSASDSRKRYLCFKNIQVLLSLLTYCHYSYLSSFLLHSSKRRSTRPIATSLTRILYIDSAWSFVLWGTRHTNNFSVSPHHMRRLPYAGHSPDCIITTNLLESLSCNAILIFFVFLLLSFPY